MWKRASGDNPWKSKLANDVDECLSDIPEEARVTLQKLRETIKAAAPEATEAIYYWISSTSFDRPVRGRPVNKVLRVHGRVRSQIGETQRSFQKVSARSKKVRIRISISLVAMQKADHHRLERHPLTAGPGH